ncbi:uncharacterized protein LOC111400964 [Olea europaea var. sylvestris]|uniref:uncharacterized protein LOC111400964 n=1 Tax=Olea europaea var. sylvestris TaxID=158386 RepID=UPI000C1D2818|nr:uncharacterized protein LOC111400964 [Olea europaea var. sylvestris]XP_022884222.1 uncharacterized protein LOC111400964 [Olea europaea var. sylvestris]XP_022884223.1 uncharacterized protein LOC111400964 [Olea europaea var. sylvestris]
MKENQNTTLYHSSSFRREMDSLEFTAKDLYQLNGHGRERGPLEFEVKTGNEPWDNEFVDAFAKDNEYGNLNFPGKEDWDEIPSDRERDADPLDSDTENNGKLGKILEFELTVIVERFAHDHDNDPRDSYMPCIAASDLFESGTNLCTDKDTTDRELPELEVFYKEVNYNIVKDICVDDGMPKEDKVLSKSIKDHCKTAKEGIDMEMLILDGLKSFSLENNEDDANNHCGTKNSYEKSHLPIGPIAASEISLDKDSVGECDVEDSMHFSEPNDGAYAKIERDVPEAESFVDSKLPVLNFGTCSSLRSFLNSLSSDGNEIAQSPNQIPSEDAISSSHAALLTNTELNKNSVQAANLLCNSKVDCGDITFNFNSPKPVAAGSTDGCAENVDAQSVKSEDECHLEFINSVKHLEASAAKCTGNKFDSNGNVHEHSIDLQDTNSTSPDGQVQSASIKDKNAQNVHDEAIQTHDVFKDEVVECGSFPVVNQVRCDEGESSFSDAGLITFSGPISYSGSLSLRSDTGAASARSFAFPVLQSEWNISPVRMEKADRRHFRRRRSWRSGLLCCKF